MSKVVIEVGDAQQFGGSTIHSATGSKAETITSSGTSQETTVSGDDGRVAFISNHGTDGVWVNFGADAAANVGRYLMPNTAREFGPLAPGETVNIINA